MDIAKKNKMSQKGKLQRNRKNEMENTRKAFQADITWTSNDKKILLEGLKKHGPENIGAISKLLPKIPPQAIQSKISEYSMTAECSQERELLNKWLNCGLYSPEDSVVPEALLFIQLFENHPTPSEAKGCDFKAIYEFLYHSCFEQLSIYDLPQNSRNILCSSLSKVESKVWPECQRDIWDYIGRVYQRRTIKKVYPGKNIDSF